MEKVFKRKGGAIILKETEFQGKHYVDIRYHYEDKDSGDLKPTQKGVSLTYREFVKLFRAIKEFKADEQFMENLEAYKDE
jgi:hypothetical protein